MLMSNFPYFIMLALGFGAVIFIHELGHFLAAKAVGIRVDQFAIGFGNAALAYRKGLGIRVGTTTPEYEKKLAAGVAPDSMSETEYRLNWFPLGGYVKMFGQEDLVATEASNDPRSYMAKPVWARMLVISMGVIFNIITAFIMFVACFMHGMEYPAPRIGAVKPQSAAAIAPQINNQDPNAPVGLQPGDLVTTLDGNPVRRFADLQMAAAMSKPGDHLVVEVQRAGELLTFQLEPQKNSVVGFMEIGVAPSQSIQLPKRMTDDELENLRDAMSDYAAIDGQIERGMVLSSFNNVAVTSRIELENLIRNIGDDPTVDLGFSSPDQNDDHASLTTTANPQLVQSVIDDTYVLEHLLGLIPAIQVSDITPGGGAESADVQAGDLIAQVDKVHWPAFERLGFILAELLDQGKREVSFVLLRGEEQINTTIKLDRKGMIGIRMSKAFDHVVVAQRSIPWSAEMNDSVTMDQLDSSSNLANALDDSTVSTENTSVHTLEKQWSGGAIAPAFPQGSSIVKVNDKEILDWRDLRTSLLHATNPNEPFSDVALTVALNIPDCPAEIINWRIPQAEVKALHDLKWQLPIAGVFDFELTEIKASNPLEAIDLGLNETMSMLTTTYLTIDRVARGSVDAKNLKGPVGIVQIGTQVSRMGFFQLLMFLAIISVNLAVLNFLPIPILDGGQFVFLMIEKIKGSPVAPAIQDLATIAGLVMIGGLFLFVTFNDIVGLF